MCRGFRSCRFSFLKSDMFMRVRVRVISNEVFAGGLILSLVYCSAHVVLPCTAMVCVKLDTVKRSPEAHLVEKVKCSNRSKHCLLYYNLPVLPLNIDKFQKGSYVSLSSSGFPLSTRFPQLLFDHRRQANQYLCRELACQICNRE